MFYAKYGTKKRVPEHSSMGWVSLLHRAATTSCLCCGQALEDSEGAGRAGLTRCKYTIFYSNFSLQQNKNVNLQDKQTGMQVGKERIDVLQTAMKLGLWLGLYQIVKLVLFPLALKFSILTPVFLVAALGVPFFAHRLVKRYRDSNGIDFFPFVTSWLITLLTFLFATMLAGIAVYIYLNYIDKGGLSDLIAAQMQEAGNTMMEAGGNSADTVNAVQSMNALVQALTAMTPLEQTKQIIASMLSWGNIFALIIAIITARIRPVSNENN